MTKHSAKTLLYILSAIAACNLVAGESPLTAEDAARIFKPAGTPLPDLISGRDGQADQVTNIPMSRCFSPLDPFDGFAALTRSYSLAPLRGASRS